MKAARHKQIGIHAVVNARGSMQHLNELSQEEIELRRDARASKVHNVGSIENITIPHTVKCALPTCSTN